MSKERGKLAGHALLNLSAKRAVPAKCKCGAQSEDSYYPGPRARWQTQHLIEVREQRQPAPAGPTCLCDLCPVHGTEAKQKARGDEQA